MSEDAAYLQPYLRAMRQHGTSFESLLWASRQTQQLRFDALTRICDFAGRSVCDAGCGQADLLEYLLQHNLAPSRYVGIEAIEQHVAVARRKSLDRSIIVKADFVREPHQLLTAAEVVVFCGSLNTLKQAEFYDAIRSGYSAAGQTLVFNFLCSARLASAEWLRWHEKGNVLEHLEGFGGTVSLVDDYLEGDCTVAIHKRRQP